MSAATLDLVMRAERIRTACESLGLTTSQTVEGLTFLRAQLVVRHMRQPDKAIYMEGMAIADGAAWDFWFNYEVFQAAKEAKQ